MKVKKEDLEVADMNVVDFGWTTFRKCNFKSIIKKEKREEEKIYKLFLFLNITMQKVKNWFYFQQIIALSFPVFSMKVSFSKFVFNNDSISYWQLKFISFKVWILFEIWIDQKIVQNF